MVYTLGKLHNLLWEQIFINFKHSKFLLRDIASTYTFQKMLKRVYSKNPKNREVPRNFENCKKCKMVNIPHKKPVISQAANSFVRFRFLVLQFKPKPFFETLIRVLTSAQEWVAYKWIILLLISCFKLYVKSWQFFCCFFVFSPL